MHNTDVIAERLYFDGFIVSDGTMPYFEAQLANRFANPTLDEDGMKKLLRISERFSAGEQGFDEDAGRFYFSMDAALNIRHGITYALPDTWSRFPYGDPPFEFSDRDAEGRYPLPDGWDSYEVTRENSVSGIELQSADVTLARLDAREISVPDSVFRENERQDVRRALADREEELSLRDN